MKKITILLLFVSLAFLVACTPTDTPSIEDTDPTLPTDEVTDPTDETTDITEPGGELPVEKPVLDHSKSIKILAIGNSFSLDALEYFWKIADDYGIEEIVIGVLYKAGARMEHHWDSITNNLSDYAYYKDTSGSFEITPNKSIEDGLKDEEWDIITLQQSSGYSGLEESYQPYLNNLIGYVRDTTNNEDIRLYWHLTWAYQQDYTATSVFESWYDADQIKMYGQILSSVQQHVVPHEEIYEIIPAGTTIQNIRTSFLGDTLTRDGYHLTYDVGRYAVALTWFHKLTGFKLEDIQFKPDNVSDIEKLMLIDATYKAIRHPFEITNSSYTSRLPIAENFTKLTLPFELGYWNDQSDTLVKEDTLSKYFVSNTARIEKTQLPAGSIIVLDGNYKFKLTFWDSEGTRTTSDFIYQSDLILTEEIWSNYQYLSISVAASDGIINLTNKVEETASKILLYKPNI